MNTQFKKQQCNVVGLALGWIGYVVGMGYFTYQHQWLVALMWMAGMPALRWTLYHFFPSISRFLGYGRIADAFSSIAPVRVNPQTAPVAVNFYSFFSCPFCPIVLARLQALQKQMGFVLQVIDVTLKPQTLMTKGIRSVPVVEVGDDRLVGNSTTEQLATLISHGEALASAHVVLV
jgi:thiol-disulfide isomerase/thioredoxin